MPSISKRSSPWPSLLASATTLGLALFGANSAGCINCNDIGCSGGFEWNAEAEDGRGLEPGTYAIEITLEGTVYALDCTITATIGQSDCSQPRQVEGDGEFQLDVGLSTPTPDWDPEEPVNGFYFRAVDVSGSDPDGSYSETRGPELVRVLVRRDGQAFVDVEYEVTYVRDDEYRGDERCGYCDEQQHRTFELPG